MPWSYECICMGLVVIEALMWAEGEFLYDNKWWHMLAIIVSKPF